MDDSVVSRIPKLSKIKFSQICYHLIIHGSPPLASLPQRSLHFPNASLQSGQADTAPLRFAYREALLAVNDSVTGHYSYDWPHFTAQKTIEKSANP